MERNLLSEASMEGLLKAEGGVSTVRKTLWPTKSHYAYSNCRPPLENLAACWAEHT